jgi:tight adherence protein C
LGNLAPILIAASLILACCSLAVRRDFCLQARLSAVASGPPHAALPPRPRRRLPERIGATTLAQRLGREERLQVAWDLAGRPGSFEAVLGWRLLNASVAFGIGLGLGLALLPALLFAPFFAVAAIRGQEIALARLARRRRKDIAAHVPDLVELLVSTTEAGLNPLIAFQRSAEVLTGPLGSELRIAARQIELGLPWKSALDQLATRTQIPALRRLVVALARSSRLGTAVGSTLRNVASELRGERRARAEELARRAPIKMLFPLVFLILPAFLLLTVGPVVLATLHSLH